MPASRTLHHRQRCGRADGGHKIPAQGDEVRLDQTVGRAPQTKNVANSTQNVRLLLMSRSVVSGRSSSAPKLPVVQVVA